MAKPKVINVVLTFGTGANGTGKTNFHYDGHTLNVDYSDNKERVMQAFVTIPEELVGTLCNDNGKIPKGTARKISNMARQEIYHHLNRVAQQTKKHGKTSVPLRM